MKTFILFLWLVCAGCAYGAIAYDSISSGNAGDANYVSSGTNSFAFANSAGDGLWVYVWDGAGTTSGVTYNGVSMSLLAHCGGSGVGACGGVGTYTTGYLYYFWLSTTNGLVTGTHNIVVSGAGASIVSAISYSGTHQTIQPDGNNSQTGTTAGSTANTSLTLTTSVANSWLLNFVATSGQSFTAVSPTVGRGADSYDYTYIFDGNAAKAAGSNSNTINSNSSFAWAALNIGVRAAAPVITIRRHRVSQQ